MSKNKKYQNRGPTPPRQPTPPPASPVARPEPTTEQIARLGAAERLAETLTAEHGPPGADAVSEPVAATLEESLKRVEVLLAAARGHADKARERENAARAEENRVAARTQSLEHAELALKQRVAAFEGREAAVSAREAACLAREAEQLEQAARLTERELDAEQDFLGQKARVLQPLEGEVARLREERDRLDAELAERRAAVEAEARATAAERAVRWAQEDATRTSREAAERRTLDEDMARERRDARARLDTELRDARSEAESAWGAERDRRGAILDARDAELDKRERTLDAQQRELARGQWDLRTDQELLVEERDALARKVERLVAERTEDLRHEVAALRQQLVDARAGRDGYCRELESRRELDRRLGDRPPEQILSDLAALERDRDALARELRERPDARAAERLAELERERSAWLEEQAALQGELARARGELATRRLAAIELETLRKEKEALEIHKQLLDGAVNELRARIDELTRQEDHRNPMTALTSLDEEERLLSEIRTTSPLGRATPTLREFADDLRHRIATGIEDRTLYYAERDVRAFLGGLAMTRLMILQGISGTGKTSLPLAFTSAVGGDIEVVEVQAGWRDRQDLVGYYNAFHRHYYATNFLQALYRAGTPACRDRLFMMVLDEINLSRPEQFFADFLSALEQPLKSRRLTLVNDPVTDAPRLMVDGRHLPIPPNVWFVGTANHDESTAEFADKTYDRAHVMEMPRKTERAHFDVEEKGDRAPISYAKLQEAFEAAAEKQADAVQKATAWLRKAPFAATLGQRFRIGWGNRLEHQLARYLPVVVETGGSIGEAMDHLLDTKVLRKLKDRHDVRATALEELQLQLLETWDELDEDNSPERCVALIGRELTAKQGEDLV
ncbi:MAG TPA: hypothetical protein VNO30_34420 [Kofleriaceae bacterium]|nr:hypothetical protein [Kofleriaceae bacterium]